MFEKLKNEIKNEEKKVIIVNLLMTIFVLTVLILQIFNQNWSSCFYCVLTLIFFSIPKIVEKRLKIDLPGTLEIIIYLFIFAAEMLGELGNFYNNVSHWDTMLHVVNGFLCAAIGFALIDILNKSKKIKTHMTPIFVTFVSFSVSMTVGAVWEIIEYGCDQIVTSDMQKDRIVNKVATVNLHPNGENHPVVIDGITYTVIYYDTDNDGIADSLITIEGGYLDIGVNDTMKDLIVNFIGAIVFSIFGFLYLKNNERFSFIEGLLPTLKEENNEENTE